MHSSNPVFSRNDVFTRNGYATFRNGPAPVPQPAPAPGAGAEQGGISYVHPGRGQQAPPPPSQPYAPQPSPVQPPTGPMRAMTMDDVISRTGILLVVALVTGALAWGMNLGWGAAIGAMVIGFVLAMVNTFKRVPSPGLIMTYAGVQGVFLGALAHALDARYPGIAVQAAAGTGIAFGVMLMLYRSGRIRVTPRFTRVLIGVTLAYLLLMIGNLFLHLFGTGFNAWGGTAGMLTAAVGVTLACLFLTLDFDMIDQGVRAGWPEQEAWRASFGLMVTLVWLYFEMLRLIAVLRGE